MSALPDFIHREVRRGVPEWAPPGRLPRSLCRRGAYLEGLVVGPVYTREDILELRRRQAEAAAHSPSDGRPAERPMEPPAPPSAPSFAGVGQRLNRELQTLMRERGVVVEDFAPLPLAAPADGPVLVRGVATRVEIDAEMTLMAPNALVWDPARLPPLRLKHGEVAGEILSLAYNALGSELRVEARVDHELGRRCPAFSIAFTPETYELVDRGGAFFHFRVLRARLDEVS